jgi:protein-disulfide isomerase
MKSSSPLAFLLLASVSCAAQAGGVKGQCAYEGKTLAFVDAYATLGPDPFEETKKVPMLWFTTVALDHAALASAKRDAVDDAITEQVFDLKSAKLQLRLDAAGSVVEGLQLYVPPGNNRSVSGNHVGDLKMKAAIAARATGQFALHDDDDLKCDLQFDVPMGATGPAPPPAKAWGTALPAGGGEPGKAYLALHRATLAGDVNAMLALVTKDRADQMRDARKEPDFSKMLELIKALEPAQVRVVSGRMDGDRAELQIDGKDSDKSNMTGEVKLKREGGSWRVEKVSTSSKMGQ